MHVLFRDRSGNHSPDFVRYCVMYCGYDGFGRRRADWPVEPENMSSSVSSGAV